MPIPFEFVIGGPPVSQQARRRLRVRQWTQDVRRAAKHVWGEDDPVPGPVMVTITYFFDSSPLDVDNVPKPILDALKGLIYVDDSQVTDLLCRKRELQGELQILNPSRDLLECLHEFRQCLHIAVTHVLRQEVSL